MSKWQCSIQNEFILLFLCLFFTSSSFYANNACNILASLEGGSPRFQKLLQRNEKISNYIPKTGVWFGIVRDIANAPPGKETVIDLNYPEVYVRLILNSDKEKLQIKVTNIKIQSLAYGHTPKNASLVFTKFISSIFDGIKERYTRYPDEIKNIEITGSNVVNPTLTDLLIDLGFKSSYPKPILAATLITKGGKVASNTLIHSTMRSSLDKHFALTIGVLSSAPLAITLLPKAFGLFKDYTLKLTHPTD